ncbi:serine/threonine-protein kinase [Limnospira platensis]|uniref:serine/threonine-protein kinase n=1 Tax=Limnospira platensis TaxID=118562 RepID=UPI0002804350|nr:serine/threonine protein kinase [Arthrospira platensis C1]UWU45615.1 Protein kinase domain-containing protein [Arthrospira platensis C1]
MSSDLTGEIIGGKYDIQARLAQGGSGIVYVAKKITTPERYAIKTLSTDENNAIKLLERETETLKRLNHPNIVKFIESGYEDRHKLVYLVLEYLDGQDIRTYFDSGADLKTKLHIFLQIIDGISHAHSKNIIHRDIKPDNIKIVDNDEQPQAKVLDFGIAIITTTILTNTIRSYHTPLFSAPEQKNLEGVFRDSDIYALGMTFLYLLSNVEARIKFQDEQNKNILYESAKDSLNSFDNHQNLINVFKQATDKDRQNRPKLFQLRQVVANCQEELAETTTIVFTIPRKLQEKINIKNNYQGQLVKIKRYLETNLKDNSGILHIQKSPRQSDKENRLTLNICVETSGKVYYGFIDLSRPTEIVIIDEREYVDPKTQELIVENGVAVKVSPVVHMGNDLKKRIDLSELIHQILEQDQAVSNEIENHKVLSATFEQWQDVIELEKQIVSDKKQVFNYQKYEYNQQRNILILTLTPPISIEKFEKITSPPLPVTISIKQNLPYNRQKQRQYGIGDIVDGEKSSRGESIEKLHISIGDFSDPEIIDCILDQGKIETNFQAQESEIEKRRKSLREIRYGDCENQNLPQVIADPSNVKPIESVLIHSFFNNKLDESQQKAVCKALATEDIFLIQGPPGTGKTSVITEIILQVLHKYPNDKILISSQSNVAVDNVLIRLSRTPEKEIKCIRIGREEKIEEDARKFEVEKAIIKWQNFISAKSLAYWQNYQEENEQLLSGIQKIAQLENVKTKNKELQVLADKLTKIIARFNSELIVSQDNLASIDFADIAIELISEKLELEQKILKLVEQYTNNFGVEYPGQKQLSNWIEEEYKVLHSILGDAQENYQKFINLQNLNQEWNERLKRKQQNLVPLFIDEIDVVGATCLGVARFKERNFDWVIIDEAGRSTASETFVPMSKGKKIILVGDHRQLPPIIEQELQERAFSEKEIHKRLLETSLFEYLYDKLPAHNKITLNNQYRMHPNIGNLVSALFYDNQVASESVNIPEKQHSLTIFEQSVYWISTSDEPETEKKERQNGKSRSNPYEAKVIKEVLSKIQENCELNNLHKEVGVIAAYRSQISILESAIAPNDQQFWQNLHIIIHTVDAFQGGECDIIIYDLVRSNRDNKLGFTSDDRRLNVALSRAKQLLIIVGDDNMAYQGRTPRNITNPFKPLIEYIDSNNNSCCRLISSKFS